MHRTETIAEGVTLHLGDCRDILPTLGDVGAIITDPPYGISYDPSQHNRYNGDKNTYDRIAGDSQQLDFGFLFDIQVPQIIWGAETFYRQLPHRGRWLCWHKRSPKMKPNSMRGGDFELAWMNKGDGYYLFFNLIHGGVINADSENGNNAIRFHPTQKPVELMKFCIENIQCTSAIVDPFMGSGSTGVAAMNLGRKFIGIEIETAYFDIACKRISEATKQTDLFIDKPAPIQLSIINRE